MERCPNCGATVREGARFCTACGFRMTASTDDGTSSPDQSAWWGPPPGNEPDAPAGAGAGVRSETERPAAVGADDSRRGGSFWDRIEGATAPATRAHPESPPRWDAGERPAANQAEGAGSGLENRADIDPPAEASSTLIITPSHEPGAAEPERDPTLHVASSREHDDAQGEALTAGEEIGPGTSVLSALNRVVRLLEEARPGDDEALTIQVSELQAAIRDARERPREIDAMLAISTRSETITAILRANERMATTIDAALRTLRDADAG